MPSIKEMQDYAREVAQRIGLDQDLFLALINQESGWNIEAGSPAGAYGLAQLMPDTAAGLGKDPTDWRQNLEGGAAYLDAMLKKYGAVGANPPRSAVEAALGAYNAGPGAVDKDGIKKVRTYDQGATGRYIDAVIKQSQDDYNTRNSRATAQQAGTPTPGTTNAKGEAISVVREGGFTIFYTTDILGQTRVEQIFRDAGEGGSTRVQFPSEAGLDLAQARKLAADAQAQELVNTGKLIPLANGRFMVPTSGAIVSMDTPGQFKPIDGAPGFLFDPVSGEAIDTNGNRIAGEQLAFQIRKFEVENPEQVRQFNAQLDADRTARTAATAAGRTTPDITRSVA